jgi:S-adenosyl methyltransferase
VAGRGDLDRFDTSVPHPARVYDVFLGGKDNFAADRAAAEAGLAAFPGTLQSVRANRAFLERTVRYLAGEAGMRRFLDIGTGLPSANNTHEVAQSVAPESRIVYVDNDPIVLAHAQVLLTSSGPGQTAYIDADLRDPLKILRGAAELLDLSEPVAVMLIGVMHFISDDDRPYEIVRTLLDAVPSGSYLAMSHLASDLYPEQMAEFARIWNERARPEHRDTLRSHAQVARFFEGLDVVDPGVVQITRWRPRSDLEAAAIAPVWGGVARKPLCATRHVTGGCQGPRIACLRPGTARPVAMKRGRPGRGAGKQPRDGAPA